MIFNPGLVYPSDGIGPYVDLPGTVVGVGEPLFDEHLVEVMTEHGPLTGWTRMPVKAPGLATIRVYRAGGSWYPDNRIIAWESTVQ